MVIGIATDHHGVKVKSELIDYFTRQGYQMVDYGTNSEDMVDYPSFAFQVGEEVALKKIDYGILLCGTGIGMSIACNKVKGVRCAKVSNVEEARLSREHNDANVLALSSNMPIDQIEEVVHIFLTTSFLGERHLRRVQQITTYEEKHDC